MSQPPNGAPRTPRTPDIGSTHGVWLGGVCEDDCSEDAWRRVSEDQKQRASVDAARRPPPPPPPPPPPKRVAAAATGDARCVSEHVVVDARNVSVYVKPSFGPAAAAAAAAKRKRRRASRASRCCGRGEAATLEEGGAGGGGSEEEEEEEEDDDLDLAREGFVKILRGVSFVARPGEVLAVLGPSGSGKTTLLNAVAGRLSVSSRDARVRGDVLFNGGRATRRTNRDIGFVSQDDVLFPSLTVRETVRYAASLRLPSRAYAKKEKIAVAEKAMTELGLSHCADTIIGGVFVRGVSGGERKRACIAVELVVDPSVCFMDEPTSGLDATVALRLAETLKTLAKDRARTVVLTIHQPSSRVMAAMDAVLLLSRGARAYYGSVKGIHPYFAALEFPMPFGMNPADFVLDLANGDASACGGDAESKTPDEVASTLARASADRVGRVDDNGWEVKGPDASTIDASLVPLDGSSHPDAQSPPPPPLWACALHEEVLLLLRRSLATRRGQLFDRLKIGQAIVVALIVGALWYGRGDDPGVAAVADVAGFLFFIILFNGFLSVFGAIFTFPDERAVVVKERLGGVFRVSSYFFARTLADVPLDLFVPCLFLPIAYWLAALRATPVAFVAHVLTVMLLTLVSSSMGLLVGAAVKMVKTAQTLASVIMLSTVLTGGFYFDKTPSWLGWTKKVSFVNHAYSMLLKIQYPDGRFVCVSDDVAVDAAFRSLSSGDYYVTLDDGAVVVANAEGRCSIADAGLLTFVDLTEGDVSVHVWALFAMLVGFRALTYVALRWISLKT